MTHPTTTPPASVVDPEWFSLDPDPTVQVVHDKDPDLTL